MDKDMGDPPSFSARVWMSLIDNLKSLSVKVFQSMTWDWCWHSPDTIIITIKPFTLIIVLHLSLCEIQLCFVNEPSGFSWYHLKIQLRGTRGNLRGTSSSPRPAQRVLDRLNFLHETFLEYKMNTNRDSLLLFLATASPHEDKSHRIIQQIGWQLQTKLDRTKENSFNT